MGVKCEIFIQKVKSGVFRPGQHVVGTVKYIIDKPTKFKTIDISFLGKGTCEWSVPAPDKTSVEYSNKEEYVKDIRNLFDSKNNQKVLLSGTFEYPFNFLLPDDIPSSLENNTGGKIEYKVIVRFVKASSIKIDLKYRKYSTSIMEKSLSIITHIVPTLPGLYSIQHSKILIGEYRVRVTAKLPFPYNNADVEVPVVIGEKRDQAAAMAVDHKNPSSLNIDGNVGNLMHL